MGHVRRHHGAADLEIMHTVLAVEPRVKLLLPTNFLRVEKDGRAPGTRLDVPKVFDDDHDRRFLIDFSHCLPTIRLRILPRKRYRRPTDFVDTLSILSCIDCSRCVRVPTLMLMVTRGAPIA